MGGRQSACQSYNSSVAGRQWKRSHQSLEDSRITALMGFRELTGKNTMVLWVATCDGSSVVMK